jgi:MacB-like periplasmic core domain
VLSWRNWAGTVIQDAVQDVRYALRWFRRDLTVTGAIVMTLAFGIGLNTGVFSVLSGLVFRSRVEKDSSTFFQVLATLRSQPDSPPRLFSSSVADLKAYRSAQGVASMAAWAVSSGRLEEDADPNLLLLVTCDFFGVYGLDRPKLGRLFESAECSVPGGGPVVLLGEQLWRDRFHGDSQILGRRILINRKAFSVVGIVPADFSGRLRGPGVWIPFSMAAPFYGGVDLFREDWRPWLTVEGRRLPGYYQAAVARELSAIAARNGRRTLVLTNGSVIQDPSNRTLAGSMTLLVSGALGLIGCTPDLWGEVTRRVPAELTGVPRNPRSVR